jgi:hypothetical protein
MDTTKLSKGDVIELKVDANAIPAGIYKVLDQMDEFIICKVGPSIQFGIATEFWGKFIEPVDTANTEMTSTTAFVKRYKNLLDNLKSSPHRLDPRRFTFCAMDPKVLTAHGLNKRSSKKRMQAPEMTH